jgi:hypothetical protein
MLVDGAGVPLSRGVTGAKGHEVSPLETILDAFVSIRPAIFEHPHPLGLDTGSRGEPAVETVV